MNGKLYWAILFEDAEIDPEIFTDEQAAIKRFADAQASWNCQLMAPYQQVYNLQAATVKVADVGGKAVVDLIGRIAALEAEVAALREDKARLVEALKWWMPLPEPPKEGKDGR